MASLECFSLLLWREGVKSFVFTINRLFSQAVLYEELCPTNHKIFISVMKVKFL